MNIPERLHTRLPDYDISKINLEDHKWVIMERVFEFGTREEVRWLFSQYPKQDLVKFLERHGKRKLSRKNLAFWSLFFHLPIPLSKKKNLLWDR